jgi:hypothetical protein
MFSVPGRIGKKCTAWRTLFVCKRKDYQFYFEYWRHWTCWSTFLLAEWTVWLYSNTVIFSLCIVNVSTGGHRLTLKIYCRTINVVNNFYRLLSLVTMWKHVYVLFIQMNISKCPKSFYKFKTKFSELCYDCFNLWPPGSLVFPLPLKCRNKSAGQGMAGGLLTPTIVFTFANVVLLGVFLQPPCHMVKATLDAIWERVNVINPSV